MYNHNENIKILTPMLKKLKMDKIISDLQKNKIICANLTQNCTTLIDLTILCDVLKNNTSTRTLYLGHNKIGVEGARVIADMLKQNTHLINIYLSGNNIGDNGLKHIMNALKQNTTLKILSVGTNEITDIGLPYIRDTLMKNKTLIELHFFGNNNITENGYRFIADNIIKSNTSLKKMHMFHMHMTRDSTKYINDALEHNRSLIEISYFDDYGTIYKICNRNKHNLRLSNLRLVDFS
jgi:Ran GTPase-activating protein (RanGAP) involved in mRNA processing and transport